MKTIILGAAIPIKLFCPDTQAFRHLSAFCC